MDIALLNIRITFQKNIVTVDKIGNHRSAWTDYYSCYATANGEGGSEKTIAGLTVQDASIAFTVRYCKTLADIDTTKFRILFNSDLYNIVSVDHMSYKKKCLKFKCEKVRR